MNALLKDKKFLEGDIDTRRSLIKARVLNPTRKQVRDYMDATTGATRFEREKFRVSQKGDKIKRKKALEMMRQDYGIDVGEVRDFTSMREVMLFRQYIDYLDQVLQ